MNELRKVAPSELESLRHCPGFVNDKEKNTAAEEGTLLHKACETHELKGLTGKQQEMVNWALDQAQEMILPLVSGDGELKIEREIKIPLLEGMTNGKIDLLVLAPHGVALVIDYKFVFNPTTEAIFNLQGYAYALGIFGLYPDINRIEIAFISPRLFQVTSCVFTREDEERLFSAVLEVFSSANSREKKLNPSHKTCQFCANATRCPALARIIELTGEGLAEELTEVLGPNKKLDFSLTTPQGRSNAQKLANRLGPLVEDWCKKVKRDNLDFVVTNNTELPDFKMIERSGRRQIINVFALGEKLKEYGYEPDKILNECSTVKITAIEDKLSKAEIKDLEAQGVIVRGSTNYFLKEV